MDGHVRLPAPQQMTMPAHQKIPEMTVVGHNTATNRESLLEKAFELGEKFVKASKEHYDPGIIGPFCLQTCIDKDMNYWIYDVAPRLGGGTNVHVNVGHPYGNALWHNGQPDGFVAVGNFDDDPQGEIVVSWSGNLRLQDDDGMVLWTGNYTGERSGPPTIADFDGDSEPEIGIAGSGLYIVVDGDGTRVIDTKC